jgi:predicted O-methyltransferase YrrM
MSSLRKIAHLLSLLARAGLRGGGTFKHILGVALHAAEEVKDADSDVRPLPSISIESLSEASGANVHLYAFSGIPASISPLEAYAIGLIVTSNRVKRAFEFGTYKGVSTTQIALNLDDGGKVWTLDLPEENAQEPLLRIAKETERAIASESGKGSLIPSDLLARVEFVRQDSAAFEPRPFSNSMDFVFVDGAHSADYVRNDSEKGWEMLRPGGIIMWHDCVPNHPDVAKFVKASTWSPKRIRGTSLAFAVKR